MSGEHEFYCYGLKTDFMGNFFPGSAALMRLAEDISEVPGGLCWCGCKATMNARVNGAGQVVKVGEQEVSRTPLVALQGVPESGWFGRMIDAILLFFHSQFS